MTIEEIAEQTKDLGIQMQPIELFEIVKNIKAPANLLVFGVGNDSAFWHSVNKGGRTVFLEGKKMWFDDICARYPFLEVYRMRYDTNRAEWKDLLDKPDQLTFEMPLEIRDVVWDVIIVDGPTGYDDSTPGRMKSIYMASKLIKSGGDVFVHDTEREVENEYCKKYLLDKNLISEVKGFAILRHYRLNK